MEIVELKQEYKEWITIVRLAHYKRLRTNPLPLENNEKKMLEELKQLLLEDGITEETINEEVSKYKNLSEEERTKQIEEKAGVLVSQIVTYLENTEEINSKDYPELYHRIQELVALNPSVANSLIKETFESEKISHCISCGDSLYGKPEPCTYYFSKKLTYK